MKYLATLLVFLGFMGVSAASNAQITLSSGDYINSFTEVGTVTSFLASTPSQFVNVLATNGVNQTWDFTGKTYTQEATNASATIISPSQAPLNTDPDFATATHVLKSANATGDTISYVYVKINSSGVYDLGIVGQTGQTAMKILSFTPPLQDVKFPLEYQQTWNSTPTINSPNFPPGMSMTINSQSVVDSWGTLILPTGGTHQTLRIRTNQLSTTSFLGNNIHDTSYIFRWVTREGFGADVSANGNQQPVSASYFVASGGNNSVASNSEDPLSIRFSQNPVSNEPTQLFYSMTNSEPVRIEMMDALGHNVRMLMDGRADAGINVVPIDPRSLDAGTYFVRITSPNMTEMRKLVIVR